MRKIIDCDSGIYIIEIEALKDFKVGIKKYSDKIFPAGYYYYIGSAQKNLKHRISRHQRKDKIVHWHIDHLTTIKSNKIKTIFLLNNAKKIFECKIASEFLKEIDLKVATKGFGNSDCKKCASHLFYKSAKVNHNHFTSLYQSTVRFIPSSKETV